MPELTREEKLKLVEKLPQRLQDFLYSEDTGAFLLYLGNKYKIPDEKVSALSKIIADIILKITPITSLAQEIANKVIADHQSAMAIAQELNDGLLAPVLMPTPVAPSAPPAIPVVPAPIPAAPMPAVPAAPAASRADQYREPTTGPEIVDLRKTPPPPMQMPVAAAPIPPRPLTFTKPVEPLKPTPLIEAEPHKITPPQPPVIEEKPMANLPRPQYIIRPPGLPPTDLPHDILDLRKDKGEF